jgi:hypothetical protein
VLDPAGKRQDALVADPVLGIRVEPDPAVHQGGRHGVRKAELSVVRAAGSSLRLARLADDGNLAGGHSALDTLDRVRLDPVLAEKRDARRVRRACSLAVDFRRSPRDGMSRPKSSARATVTTTEGFTESVKRLVMRLLSA